MRAMFMSTILYGISSIGVLCGIPADLQQRIDALALEDVQFSYLENEHCIAVIGMHNDERKAFIALSYLSHSGPFIWTSFKEVPFNQENDTFGLVCQGLKVVTIQSSSALHHENATGYHIFFDPYTINISLQPIEASRIVTTPEAVLRFATHNK